MYPNNQQPGQTPDPNNSYSQPPANNPPQDPLFSASQGGQLPPQVPVENIFQTQPSEQNSKKGLIIGIIVGAIFLILLVGGAVAYMMLNQKPAEEVKEDTPGPLKSTLVVQDIETSIKKAYPSQAAVETPAIDVTSLVTEKQSVAPPFSPEGYHSYKVSYESNAGFSYKLTKPAQKPADDSAVQTEVTTGEKVADKITEKTDKAEDSVSTTNTSTKDSIEKLAIKALTDLKLEKSDRGLASEGVSISTYVGRGVVCSVSSTLKDTVEDGYVSCGELDTYKKLAAEIQPYADGITDLDPNSTLYSPVTSQSDSGGYQKANIQVADPRGSTAVAYFYKKDSGRWLHLVTFARKDRAEKLSCDVFNNIDKQKAYLNTPCVNADKTDGVVAVAEKK